MRETQDNNLAKTKEEGKTEKTLTPYTLFFCVEERYLQESWIGNPDVTAACLLSPEKPQKPKRKKLTS